MILVMMITTTMVVSAKQPSPPSPEDPLEIQLPAGIKEKIKTKVNLTNEKTGEIILLNPKLVRYQRDITGLTEISYEVGIPSISLEESYVGPDIANFLFPSEVYAASKSYNGCDSTISGCANLTFFFTDFGNHMYANSYQVVWTKVDPAVSFISGTLGGKCFANWYGRPGTCDQTAYGVTNYPVSGRTYYKTPSFGGSGNQTYVTDLDGQYAYQRLNMRRGSTNWSFYTCVAIGGGGLSFGCN